MIPGNADVRLDRKMRFELEPLPAARRRRLVLDPERVKEVGMDGKEREKEGERERERERGGEISDHIEKES
jgi:hypothetical protein